MFSTAKAKGSAKKEVEVSQFGVFTKNNLSQVYQLGYDEVIIYLDNETGVEDIKQRIAECLGFEIININERTIEIRSIAHTLEQDFDVLLRKTFLITKQMGDELFKALKDSEFSKLKNIRTLESLNNKFVLACIRILNKRGYSNPDRTMQMYDMLKLIERFCDEFKHICDIKYTRALDKRILSFFDNLLKYYDNFYQLFYKFSVQGKKKVYLDRKELLQSAHKLLQNTKAEDTVALHHLLAALDKAYDAAGEYFTMIL